MVKKNSYTMGCPPVRKIIHSLKHVDYLHVQADNPWYNYYVVSGLLIQRSDKICEICGRQTMDDFVNNDKAVLIPTVLKGLTS